MKADKEKQIIATLNLLADLLEDKPNDSAKKDTDADLISMDELRKSIDAFNDEGSDTTPKQVSQSLIDEIKDFNTRY